MEAGTQQVRDVRSMLTQLRNEQGTKVDGSDNGDNKVEEVSWEKRKSKMSNESADDIKTSRTKTTPSPSIEVVVRVRPLNETEIQRRDSNSFHFPGNGAILIEKQTLKPFTFSVVFEPEAIQQDLFEHSGVKKLIDKAIEGFTCTCFAFGQTGAGKTYTLLGPDGLYDPPPDALSRAAAARGDEISAEDSSFGIIPRSLVYLLERIGQLNRENNTSIQIQAHFIEIYNEHIRDLLLLNPRRQPQIRYRKDTGFYLENVFKVACETLDDLMAVLEEGIHNRHVGSTHSNDASSRGHTILTLEIDCETVVAERAPKVSENGKAQLPQDDLVVHRRGKLTFVDLAGSEKIPGGAAVLGDKDKVDIVHYLETNTINKSLLVLGNCISALSDPKRRNGYIPFRDSNLTKLLCDCLGGNGYTLMIACVTPSSGSVSDSINTLRYAQRAKNIKNLPKVRMDPHEELFFTLRKEVKALRQENYYLREQLNLPFKAKQQLDLDDKAIQYSPRTTRDIAPYDAPRQLPRHDRFDKLDRGGVDRFDRRDRMDDYDRLERHDRAETLPIVRQFGAPIVHPLQHAPRSMPDLDQQIVPRNNPYYDRPSPSDQLMLEHARARQKSLVDYQRGSQPQRLPPPRAGVDMSLYEMLQEYMVENELLRKEKLDMLRSHNRNEREREIIFKDYDRLRRKYQHLHVAISRSLHDVNSPASPGVNEYLQDPYTLPAGKNYGALHARGLPAAYDYSMPVANGPQRLPYNRLPPPPPMAPAELEPEPDYNNTNTRSMAYPKASPPLQYVLKPQQSRISNAPNEAPEPYYPQAQAQPRPQAQLEPQPQYGNRNGSNVSNGTEQSVQREATVQPPPSYNNTPPATSIPKPQSNAQGNGNGAKGGYAEFIPFDQSNQNADAVDNMVVGQDVQRKKPPHRVEPMQPQMQMQMQPQVELRVDEQHVMPKTQTPLSRQSVQPNRAIANPNPAARADTQRYRKPN